MSDILAFDPGDTTGVAIFSDQGELKQMTQLKLQDLIDFLGGYEFPVSLVIVEDFRLFKRKAMQQVGSTMPAPQVIGAIKTFASMKGVEVVLQPANIKPLALKWSGIIMPGNHADSHQWDAYLHGYYWLVSNGILQTKLQRELS